MRHINVLIDKKPEVKAYIQSLEGCITIQHNIILKYEPDAQRFKDELTLDEERINRTGM